MHVTSNGTDGAAETTQTSGDMDSKVGEFTVSVWLLHYKDSSMPGNSANTSSIKQTCIQET